MVNNTSNLERFGFISNLNLYRKPISLWTIFRLRRKNQLKLNSLKDLDDLQL